MDKAQATHHSNAVSHPSYTYSFRIIMHFNYSVLNTFKSMVQDDILVKEDMYILDRMRDFLKREEVFQFAAAKAVRTLIERFVCSLPIYIPLRS